MINANEMETLTFMAEPEDAEFDDEEELTITVKFQSLYRAYPNKWIVIYNYDWYNGKIDFCAVHGVYDTEEEGLEVLEQVLREKDAKLFQMVKEEEEEECSAANLADRVKFQDLYDIYPNKWVVSGDDTWKNGRVDTCVVYGVYDTQDEGRAALREVLQEKPAGLTKAVREEEETGKQEDEEELIVINIAERVKFQDLYDMYPNKWVIICDHEWKNGDIDTCVVYGVYGTEDEGHEVLEPLLYKKSAGLFKMVKEEDELGFIFVMAN
ncbi:MAG: hypothetical protein FWG68_05315 [Defluviitaleaceae bacterium]|nr:hypothetical protein [Defluviitaleaceae bacterium]